MKLHYILYFLFLKSALIFGQKGNSNNESDSVLTYRYHNQFEALLYVDAHKAQIYIDSLSQVSKANRFAKSRYYYQYDLGAINFVEHHLQDSKKHYEKAYQLSKTNNWHTQAISAKIWLANLDYFANNFSSAQTQYLDVLNESSKIEFVEGIANSYYGLANLQDDKRIALKYLIKVDSVYEKYKTVSPVLANTYDFIGRIYLETFKNTALAKEYFLKALDVSKKTNYLPGIDYVTNELKHLDFNDADYEDFHRYLNGLLDHSIQQKDTISMARNLTQMGKLELYSKRFNLAEEHLKTALDYFMILEDHTSQSHVNLLLAQLHIKKKDPTKAQSHLDRIENIQLSPRNSKFIEDIYKVEIEILVLSKDFEKALKKQQEFDSLNSTFVDQKNNESFLAMERRFQTKKKEQEIALLTSQSELTKKQKSNQRNLLLSILLVVILAAFSFYSLFRNRQKVNRKLEELDAFKSKFYVNISHEFRTPLTLLLGPIEKQLDETDLSPEKRSELNLMHRNTHRLLNLVNQLLDLSKLESGRLKLHVSQGNIKEFLYALTSAFEYQASQKNIDYKVDIKTDELAWFDKDLMEKVIINLLSNAFKYSPKNREIIFKAISLDDELTLYISNEGHPLSKIQIEKLFDRFYQAEEHSEGFGIGLSYVKELVNLSYGNISVEQMSNTTLVFKVTLPMNKHQFKTKDIGTPNPESNFIDLVYTGDEISMEKEQIIDEDLQIMLLVEDNQDIRTFIKSSFKDQYQIVETANGKEGLTKAIELIPDIIISDVMMPMMDGFEMTSILKQDERTCHIPIVLLTAKAEEADEFIGLNTGADDYIIKPFKIKLLQSRVKNLLDNRDNLRQRYSQELVLKPKGVHLTNLDELFFDKVKIILDEKLTESSFSVEDFSKAVGMSRMQLHRKLKALTGLTTTEFVRKQRLKLATTLIGQSDINISEIGYMVGFNDHSYFTKCFKQAYGCTPSEYNPSKT